MSDAIKNWLTEQLGVIINVESVSFLRMVQNGYLIAQLMHSLGLISDDQLTFAVGSKDSESVLNHVTVWLRTIGFEFDEETRNGITGGKLSCAIKLFYKLYLTLKGKDKVHFISDQITKVKLSQGNTRFQVVPVVKGIEDPSRANLNPLSHPLDKYQHVIQWHKHKHRNLIDKCTKARKVYEEHIQNLTKKETQQLFQTCCAISEISTRLEPAQEWKNDTYEELIQQSDKAKAINIQEPHLNISKRIIKKIKRKVKEEKLETTLHARMEIVLLNDLWNIMLNSQEEIFESAISKKMLRQSGFEKQIATKVYEIREYKKHILEIRQKVEDEVRKQEDKELSQEIFLKERQNGEKRWKYFLERNRIINLRANIYAEKTCITSKRLYDMCYQIVMDITDIALIEAEYFENYEEEILFNKKHLRSLFISDQPIFPLIDDQFISVIQAHTEETEEPYLLELERQNAIEDKYFEDYCKFIWPSSVKDQAPEFIGSLDEIQRSTNILAHIIFRLLLVKYPKPIKPPPPDIPKVDIAVCINNLRDATVFPVLSKLLAERQVKLIHLDDAINYCLEAYKKEISEDCPEAQFIVETHEALDAIKQGKKKSMYNRVKPPRKTMKGKLVVKKIGSGIHKADKQLQTSRNFDCDKLEMSPAAELGRLALEILSLGDALNDKLIVKMFIEYLKCLKDIRGWVLVNYPQSIGQAMLLEEALTSKAVPLMYATNDNSKMDVDIKSKAQDIARQFQADKPVIRFSLETEMAGKDCLCVNTEEVKTYTVEQLVDLDYRYVQQNDIPDDPNMEFRTSKFLPNHDVTAPESNFDTYLTAYINIIGYVFEDCQEFFMPKYNPNGDLHIFYQNQGCLYSLYYKKFDLATIKHLAKLIIGDDSVQSKTSLQIFGDTVLYLEADLNQEEPLPRNKSESVFFGKKREKKVEIKLTDRIVMDDAKLTKFTTSKTKGKTESGKSDKESIEDSKRNEREKKGKKKGFKIPEVVIVREDKETQIPEQEMQAEEVEEVAEPEAKPGELEWKYVDLSIPDAFQIVLATLWERIEDVYLRNFKEAYMKGRIFWNDFIPFIACVRRYMRTFMARPDDKHKYLYEFQKMYNEFDVDMKDDDEAKAEMHCRIYEFREEMSNMSDERRKVAEEERKRVIAQEWIPKQFCELANAYVQLLYLEIGRCTDTLQLLRDYYTAMVTKMPSEDAVLEKPELYNILFNEQYEFENIEIYSNFLRELMTNDTEYTTSPFHQFFNNSFDIVTATVRSHEEASLNAVSKMEVYFQPKGETAKQQKAPKNSGKSGKKLPKFSGLSPEVKEVGLKLIEEWRCAINGEILRVKLQFSLVKSLFNNDFNFSITYSTKALNELKDEVIQRYEREIKSIKTACEVFSRAVEEEVPLQQELVLEGDKFYINPKVLLFEDALPEPQHPIKEYVRSEVFSMEQLNDIADILLEIAPSGIMPERAFIFLLQDMIAQNAEDGRSSIVPASWQELTTEKMNRLSFELFGNVDLVDWKDFVIYNLCVEFPTEEELFETRSQFIEQDPDFNEVVHSYQYDVIKFWFEKYIDANDPHELYRLNKVKELLYKMYRTIEGTVNYIALLLTFSKDEDPIIGVAKALELSLGKYVCWQEHIGEAFKGRVRHVRNLVEQERVEREVKETEQIETVDAVVKKLIDKNLSVTRSTCDPNDHFYCWNELMYEPYHYDGGEENIENSEMSGAGEDKRLRFLAGDKFFGEDIGFRVDYSPPKAYYLPFDLIVNVLMAAMPWHSISQNVGDLSFRQKLEIAYETCRNSEFDNLVLMHEFLNSKLFKNIIQRTCKFVIRKPIDIITQLIKDS